MAEAAREVSRGAAGQQAGPRGIGPEPSIVHQPGGDLLNRLQHPSFVTFERLFRVLPEEGWFNPKTSPKNPFKLEFGSFTVPQSGFLLVCDYAFTPLRQSGMDPFDFVYAEDGRFSGMMGFDISVNGRRTSDIFYQLDPSPTSFGKTAFAAPVGSTRGVPSNIVFDKAAANSFDAVGGDGTALLPARPNVQGARGMPFTMLAPPSSVVSMSATIFRRVTAPLAGLQATMSGFTMHTNTVQALLERMRPR